MAVRLSAMDTDKRGIDDHMTLTDEDVQQAIQEARMIEERLAAAKAREEQKIIEDEEKRAARETEKRK